MVPENAARQNSSHRCNNYVRGNSRGLPMYQSPHVRCYRNGHWKKNTAGDMMDCIRGMKVRAGTRLIVPQLLPVAKEIKAPCDATVRQATPTHIKRPGRCTKNCMEFNEALKSYSHKDQRGKHAGRNRRAEK